MAGHEQRRPNQHCDAAQNQRVAHCVQERRATSTCSAQNGVPSTGRKMRRLHTVQGKSGSASAYGSACSAVVSVGALIRCQPLWK